MSDDPDEWSAVEGYELASEKVKECAESVFEDNPDFTKSQAFAICQDRANKGQLDAPETTLRILQTDIRPPGPVSRTEHDDGSVTYRNLLFIAPGEWTDSESRETIFYSPDSIAKLADNPEDRIQDTSVNINHEHRDQLMQVGSFDPDSLTVTEGHLFGDLTLHGRTSNSEDAIELLDLAMETEGEDGAGGLSIEIPVENEVTEFDADRNMRTMLEFDLAGLAIVTDPASGPVDFSEQFADRAIAMSDAESIEDVSVRVLEAPQTTIPDAGEEAVSMEAEELDSLIRETVRDELQAAESKESESESGEEGGSQDGEEDQELQEASEVDMLQDLIEQAENEGFDPSESTVQELTEFIESELDGFSEEAQQAYEDLTSAFLETVEAESIGAASAEAFLDWLDQVGADEDEDGMEEESGHEDEEAMPEAQQMEKRIEELERKLENLAEGKGEPQTRVAQDGEGVSGVPIAGHSQSEGYLTR